MDSALCRTVPTIHLTRSAMSRGTRDVNEPRASHKRKGRWVLSGIAVTESNRFDVRCAALRGLTTGLRACMYCAGSF